MVRSGGAFILNSLFKQHFSNFKSYLWLNTTFRRENTDKEYCLVMKYKA